jgi:hypothetical protein
MTSNDTKVTSTKHFSFFSAQKHTTAKKVKQNLPLYVETTISSNPGVPTHPPSIEVTLSVPF